MRKLKLFSLALMALFATSAWATLANWTFESNATGLTISDSGSASTAREQYSNTGSSWSNAAGSYGLYANLGSTKGSSTTITTTTAYTNIDSIALLLGTTDRGKTEFALQICAKADFSSGVTDVQTQVTIKDNISALTSNTKMGLVTYKLATPVSGYVRIILAQASGSNNKKMIVDNLAISYVDCNAPASALSLTATPATVYVGDEVTFHTDGGNGGTISLVGGNSETITFSTDTTWTATSGTHTFTASQAKNGNYCAQEAELEITVLEKTPVDTVIVAGKTSAYIGDVVTYTATAENAEHYQWTLDGVNVGGDSAKYIYTAEDGEHSIVCKARNQFNEDGEKQPTWKSSLAKVVTVTKLCGELITLTAETASGNIDKDIAISAGTHNVLGGTAHQKTDKNGKLGSNNYYISLTLASGYTFKKGDTVRVVSSSDYTKLHLFSDAGVSSIAEKDNPAKNDYVVLKKGASKIYLYRNSTDGSAMNPTVTSISVRRACEIGTDATIDELTVQGKKVEETDGAFRYTVRATDNATQVAVEYETKHPLATATPESDFKINVPDGGAAANTAVITVTAEDGTTQKTYTVYVDKAAEPSIDATLKSISVDGKALDDFDAATLSYDYVLEYDATAALTVAAETNDELAKAVITQAASETGKATVVVTAEDGTTKKTYTINFSLESPAPIIRAVHTGGKTADVAGSIGGSAKKNTQDGSKLGSDGHYFGIALADSKKFQVADSVVFYASLLNGGNKATIFKESAGTNSLSTGDFNATTMTYSFVLTAATDSIFIVRKDSKCNPNLKMIKVYRPEFTVTLAVGTNASTAGVATVSMDAGALAVATATTGTGTLEGYFTAASDGTKVANADGTLVAGNVDGFVTSGKWSLADAATLYAVYDGVPTALDNTDAEVKAVKRIENGMLVIEKNGKLYNAQGQEIR